MTDTNDTSEPTEEAPVEDPNEPYVRPIDPEEINGRVLGVQWGHPDLDLGEAPEMYPFDLTTKKYEVELTTSEVTKDTLALITGGEEFGPPAWIVESSNGHQLQVWDWFYGEDDAQGNPQLRFIGRFLCGPHTYLDGVLQPHE